MSRAKPDGQCYMRLIGRDNLADCGRRFVEGRNSLVPFVVCEDCAGDFLEVVELARDRRAVRKEWEV